MEGGQRLKHVCKFCSKSFACGRSLGGHIRCHLPKPGYELRENPKKTWRVAADHHQSEATTASSETDTENLGLSKLNQGHGKSKRSGLAGNNTNNSHSSVSEVVEAEHQQEEVDIAMCLIMLSRDVGPWGCGKNSQNSKKKRKRSSEKVTAVNGEKQVTVTSHEHLQKGLKMKGIEVSGIGFWSNDQSNNLSESKMGKDRCEDYSSENVRKGENFEEFQESENGFLTDENGMNSEWFKVCTPEKNYNKRSKFECTTCNKVFHSYQALGGHRASHKKQLGSKDCALTQSNRDDQELTKIRSCPSPQPDVEKLQPTQCDDGDQVFTEIVLGSSSTLSKKVVQKHECPICFRVFPSGQALGGHKRSHQLASSNSQSTKTADVTERSSSSETRDMLDLNLPPAVVHVQEEANATIATASSSNSLVGLIKPYWWVENPHKHEAFLSLISN